MPSHNQFIRDLSGAPSPSGLKALGAFFPIEFQVPPQIAQVLIDEGKPVPDGVAGPAMIDTGATLTCVHEPILTGLGLNPIGVANAGTARGPVQLRVYPGRIVIPSKGWTIELPGGVAGVDLTGQMVPLDPPQQLIALLGRNVLEQWIFTYNGPGGFRTVSV